MTDSLNILGGAVKSVGDWKKFWKLWCKSHRHRKNDLSITLLDLKLITFLESITDYEKKLTKLKNFSNGEISLLKADELFSMISDMPILLKDVYFIEMIQQLQCTEQTAQAYKTKVEFNSNKLTDLILKKEEIEKDIESTEKILNSNEKDAISALFEEELLNRIRNWIKFVLNRPTSTATTISTSTT